MGFGEYLYLDSGQNITAKESKRKYILYRFANDKNLNLPNAVPMLLKYSRINEGMKQIEWVEENNSMHTMYISTLKLVLRLVEESFQEKLRKLE